MSGAITPEDRTVDVDAAAGSSAGDASVPTDPEHPAATPDPAPTDAGWVARAAEAVRRHGTAIVVVLAAAVLGAAWTLASPVGSAPDGQFHLASIWCSPTAPDDACTELVVGIGDGTMLVNVPVEIGPTTVSCFAGSPDLSASACPPIEGATEELAVANDGRNPGWYYAALGMFVGGDPVESALLARLASWAVSGALLAAGWLVLPRRLRLAFPLVLLVVAVPHALFLWSSTNPSGVTIAAVVAAWCAAVGVLGAPDLRRSLAGGALLTAAVLAAASSRADGTLLTLVAVVAAVILLARPDRDAAARAGAVVGIGFAGLFASLVAGSLAARGSEGLLAASPTTESRGDLWGNLVEVPYYLAAGFGRVSVGFDSGPGWDTVLPRITWVPTMAVFFGLVFWGLARTDLAKGLALAFVLLAIVAAPLISLWRNGDPLPVGLQARAVLPLIPVLGVTALHRRAGPGVAALSGAQLGSALALVTIAHSAALHRVIRRHVTGIDVTAFDLDAGREWWWEITLGPNAVWLLGTVAFAVLALVVGRAISVAGRRATE